MTGKAVRQESPTPGKLGTLAEESSGSLPHADFSGGTEDSFTLGRNIRHYRKKLGFNLERFAQLLGRAPSQLSDIENGKREPTLQMLRLISQVLDVSPEKLLSENYLGERDALEVQFERAKRGAVFRALGIEPFRVSKSVSDEALRAILSLNAEIERLGSERQATPEEARRVNTLLRGQMRAVCNHFSELEERAEELLRGAGYEDGPVSQRIVAAISARLGFSPHYVSDLPHSTRSVVDRRNGRVYLNAQLPGADVRAPLLRALASVVCEHEEPRNYTDFLRQRVEANYLAGAVLVPRASCLKELSLAKRERRISMEELRDAFAVSYEMAAHRFTNLASEYLDLPVHFMKVHESGTLTKAYENDGVRFPSDALGNFEGAIVCRNWTARTVFAQPDRFNPWYQYTDMADGATYWCTSRVEKAREGLYSVSVGVRFDDVKWFVGRDTSHRTRSFCPDERCCKHASAALREKWATKSWPEAATPTSLLAALPTGSFPGVETAEVFSFLESHEGDV